jgi:hypothetical protein
MRGAGQQAYPMNPHPSPLPVLGEGVNIFTPSPFRGRRLG